MPETIIRPDREVDWYVVWSSIVDAPICWGTRGEVMDDMRSLDKGGHIGDRLARTDRNGTSALWPPTGPLAYSWEARAAGRWNGLTYEGRGAVRIEQLPELCARLADGRPVDDLLEPLERG